ncbi:MAG: YitT family protein [Bacteroidales bacterium]|nr:YitT family protein [Candidatus Cryptobacteroides onthequi]
MFQYKTILTVLKEYLLMTVGLMSYVLGWLIFLVPNNLIGGGVTGFASIVQYATHGVVKIGLTYFVINAVLLISAVVILGKSFGFKTIYAVAAVSLGLSALPAVIPDTISNTLAIENGKLMSTLMGAILSGVGIGMSMSQGGSTGGTDIVALIINKYRNISPGKIILSIDVCIILSSLLMPSFTPAGDRLPFAEKIVNMVYGLILVTVNGMVLDLYLSGSRQSMQVFICSHSYPEIADMVTRDLHRGVTVLDGKGWFTQNEAHVLMIVIRKTDLPLLLRQVKAIDQEAFISVSSATAVYGKGFDQIKGKSRQ